MIKKHYQSIVPLFVTVATPYPKNLDLSGLKDVILGEKPPIFPLTIGWWIVLFVVFLLLFVVFFCVKKRFFPTPCAYALQELKKIENASLTPVEAGKEISKLLKRVSIFKFGREEVALLTDDEWAFFLKNKGHLFFSDEEADFVAKSTWMPPQKDIAISLDSLYTHTREWIKVVMKEK